jgi:WD40 repeat protein
MNLDDLTPIGRATHEALLAAGETLDGSGPAGGLDDLLKILAAARQGRSDGPVPTRIGRFEIVRELGGGGQGVVYLARDSRLGCLVALKVSHSDALLTPDGRNRLVTEARAVATLDHPNIVPLRELIDDGPLCGLVMPFIDGPSLSQWLKARSGPVPPRLAAAMMADLARAVAHAHARNVLHRDIKPGNILLQPGPEGDTPRLADFGLAYLRESADPDHEQTPSTARLGTIAYMSPESAAGKARAVDERSDIYSLGATLYEVLTGRPPFEGANAAETLTRVLLDEPTPPRRLRPGLPRDVETIVLKAMAKAPADRYPTADALADDLDRFLEDRPIQARRPTIVERASKWSRRHAGIVTTGLIGLLVLLAGTFAAGYVYIKELTRHNAELVNANKRADQRANDAMAARRLADRHFHAAQLRLVQQQIDAREYETAQDLLAYLTPRNGNEDLRGFAWCFLRSLARRELVCLPRVNYALTDLSLSRDETILAAAYSDGRAILWDAANEQALRTLKIDSQPLHGPALSPDNRLLAVDSVGSSGVDLTLHVVDVQTEAPLGSWKVKTSHTPQRPLKSYITGDGYLVFTWRVGGLSCIRAWDLKAGGVDRPPVVALDSPGEIATAYGASVFAICEGGHLELRDVRSGVVHRSFAGDFHDFRTITLSPDGLWVGIAMSDGVILLWDASDGTPAGQFDAKAKTRLLDIVQSLSVSRNGIAIGAVDEDGLVHVWDRAVNRQHVVRPDEFDRERLTVSILFSPDGTRMATTSFGNPGGAQPVVIWDVATGSRVAIMPGREHSVSCFTADGRSLIMYGSSPRLWHFAPCRESAQPLGHDDEAWSVAFTRDARLLATGGDEDDDPLSIRIWDPATGALIRAWQGGEGTVSALAFSRDGRVLATSHIIPTDNVRLWDPESGRLLATLTGHTDRAKALAFGPDGLLATASRDKAVRLWDIETRQCVGVMVAPVPLESVDFSFDGRAIATSGVDHVQLWDVESRALLKDGGQEREFQRAPTFSPDGTVVATAGRDGRVAIRDARDLTILRSLQGPRDELLDLAFSPDGRSIAAAGKSGVIRLWDVVTGQELLALNEHKAPVNGLAFAPDGSCLVSCSHDGQVRIWRADRSH